MKHLLILAIFTLSGCAGVPVCKSEAEETVSLCRAERDCGKGRTGNILGAFLGGMGSGLAGGANPAAKQYSDCVDRNLSAQKANAGIPDNTLRCASTRTASDTVETVCR